MKKLTTFWVDENLLKEFKVCASDRGLSMASFIITMMKEVVEDSKLSKSPEYKEEMIRVKIERKLKAEEEEIQAEARWKDKERRINDGTYVWGSDAEFEQSLKENL